MVTTITVAVAGQNVRLCFEGSFRDVSFNRDLRLHVGKIICDKLKERKISWAKSALIYIHSGSNGLGLTGRLEPAGTNFRSYETLQIKLSYDNLAGEDLGLELPSFVIRRSVWRS